ncbi:MAG: DNA polymerase III subunit gamma/tau [Lachnospiraceae bacterium]|nr:DNA polymerase III subunit gamma/tau [Lachnospiraceae bacterium]
MSYTALYRKFRPASFDDVKGQDHIVTTLRNQIRAGRIGHAYLFCGTRGTGKTTVAKILARAVNCENPVNGSPCGECTVCRAIASGSALNVMEIDAASNNGVEQIRTIIDEVAYSPTIGRYKVYIIDEAHMISPQGFNALLKTLEEPPEYVIFILATTDPQKLLTTILSRCQRYDFHRITIETIQARLQYICDSEQLDVEERALRYIAKMGDGSMRDALSLLDQCVAFHYGERLTYDSALDVLGAVDTAVFDKMLRAVCNEDVVGTMNLLQTIVDQGRELAQFTNDLIWYIRCVMLMQTDAGLEDVIDLNSEDMARLRETAQMFSRETVTRYIYILSELTSQFRYSSQKRILLEVTLIRLCRPEMDGGAGGAVTDPIPVETSRELNIVTEAATEENGSGGGVSVSRELDRLGLKPAELHLFMDDLNLRLTRLEDTFKKGLVQAAPEEGVQEEKVSLPKALPEDIRMILNRWDAIMAELSEATLAPYMENVKKSITEDGRLQLVWNAGPDNEMSYGRVCLPENVQRFKEAVAKVIKKDVDPVFTIVENSREYVEKYPDISVLAQGMPVVEENEEPMDGWA